MKSFFVVMVVYTERGALVGVCLDLGLVRRAQQHNNQNYNKAHNMMTTA